MKNFTQARLLGEGAFGAVCVIYDEDGAERAGKVFEEEYEIEIETLREITILRALDKQLHPYLIGDLDFSTSFNGQSTVVMSMPLYQTDLSTATIWLTPPQIKKISFCLLLGVEFLHASNLAHRDLKPENVLLDDAVTPKIIDFSLAKWMTTNLRYPATKKKQKSHQIDNVRSTTLLGTTTYICPQMIREEPYSTKCDIFSLAVIILEVLQKKRIESSRDKQALKMIDALRQRLNKDKAFPKLLFLMLADSEAERLSASECIEKSMFDGLRECDPKIDPIFIDPIVSFSKPQNPCVAYDQICAKAKMFGYALQPTANAAYAYFTKMPCASVLFPLQTAAKLFESEVADPMDMNSVCKLYNYKAQAAYEKELLQLLDFNLLC